MIMPQTNSRMASPPRRAASDASFWRSKRGKQDWLDDALDPNDPRRRWRRNSGDDWGAPEDHAAKEREMERRVTEGEEEWDVEGMAEGRVVQVMFTVPKQRLRVVNADVDGGSLVSVEKEDGKTGGERQAKLTPQGTPKATPDGTPKAAVEETPTRTPAGATPAQTKDGARSGSPGRVKGLVSMYECQSPSSRESTPKGGPSDKGKERA